METNQKVDWKYVIKVIKRVTDTKHCPICLKEDY